MQYQLLKQGFDTAPMTTDCGIDLVALFSSGEKTRTIQVKTTEYGNLGTASEEGLVWADRKDCPTEYIGLVASFHEQCWLIPFNEFKASATSAGNSVRLGWNVYRKGPQMQEKFKRFEIDTAVLHLFESLQG